MFDGLSSPLYLTDAVRTSHNCSVDRKLMNITTYSLLTSITNIFVITYKYTHFYLNGWDFRATLTNNTKQTWSEEYYVQNNEKRKEIGKSAGYWTMQNSHMNLVQKGLRYQALRFTQLIGFDYTVTQYKQTKCTFPTLIFQFLIFLCLLYVSNPRVHIQEDSCIHSYGMVHHTLFWLFYFPRFSSKTWL